MRLSDTWRGSLVYSCQSTRPTEISAAWRRGWSYCIALNYTWRDLSWHYSGRRCHDNIKQSSIAVLSLHRQWFCHSVKFLSERSGFCYRYTVHSLARAIYIESVVIMICTDLSLTEDAADFAFWDEYTDVVQNCSPSPQDFFGQVKPGLHYPSWRPS